MNEQDQIVQACVTSVGFPEDVETLEAMLEKNESFGPSIRTDIDVLFNFSAAWDVCWTAPKWIGKGDILFFYQTVRSLSAANRLSKRLLALNRKDDLSALQPSIERLRKTAGCIFGYAIVEAQSIDIPREGNDHFRGRCFAPLASVHLLIHPLDVSALAPEFFISRRTITTLTRKSFGLIRDALVETNGKERLPILANGTYNDAGLHAFDEKRWRDTACNEATRYRDEQQVREYFIDHLLREIKDEGTAVHEECECMRSDGSGIADYFISIDGHWVPVEAKLNARAEAHLPRQLQKYNYIASFKPSAGPYKGKPFECQKIPLSLVADQWGLYTMRDAGFDECSSEEPRWSRQRIRQNPGNEIRSEIIQWIRKYLPSSASS